MKKIDLIFLTGAIWNWAVSIVFFIMSVAIPSAFTDLGFIVPNTMVYFHSFLAFVGLFGIAFFIACKDPPARHGIALLGAFEKFLIPSILIGYFFVGGMGVIILGLTAVDIVYGVLFIWILRQAPAA
ncbi:MAG: hypothetical protein GYA24_04745 [Candidatus Lokiarchaeota archaeon]|nr:hypothetical protein [Candidatus Lokiarchaeota archaeon]